MKQKINKTKLIPRRRERRNDFYSWFGTTKSKSIRLDRSRVMLREASPNVLKF